MANLITLSRLILLILVVVMAYNAPPVWQLLMVPLLIVVFVTDGLDGYVARKRKEVSLFGAMFDIAGDRIVELSMWIVLADLDLVPIWVPLVFVIRGVIVDTIRATEASGHRQSPFAMMTTPAGKWLVGSKFMRIFYAVLKAVVFCWLLLLYPLPQLVPDLWVEWGGLLQGIGFGLVLAAVALCLVRGLPVISEFVYAERDVILGSLTGEHKPRG